MAQDITQYLSPHAMVDKGKAPGMDWKLLSDKNGVKEFVLIFTKGDEVLSGISDFAIKNHITSARFTGIGALKSATTAWFDLQKKSYKLNQVNQQVELVSLIGDIALFNNQPAIHAHLSIGLPDGSTRGGHLIEAICYPTVELFMTAFSTPLQKELDKETDLKLIHPEIK
jgi:predicted DNA-binding protein with PD1-like motif